jgi:hypothetical protein
VKCPSTVPLTEFLQVDLLLQKLDLRRAQNSSDPKAKALNIIYFKVLRKVVKEAEKQRCNTLMAKSDNKIKATWKVIKKQTRKLPQGNRFILVNAEKLKDPKMWPCLK